MEDLMQRLQRISFDDSENSPNQPEKQVAKKDIPTSAHTLLSCVHGRDRREERQIGKRDLQAAIKYGVKELSPVSDKRTGAVRWKYTYKDIVYITDSTSRVEITSWVKPIVLKEAYVTQEDVETHNKLSLKFQQRGDLLTSHTVFIVDQSGSMNNHDVDNFKTRSDAVFGTLALDYIGKQIDQNSLTHTDCASLIFMRDDAEVVFTRESIDNVLYNKLVNQIDRRAAGHGNYLPALKKGIELLDKDVNNPNCSLLVLFLSDGRPSDCDLRKRFEEMVFMTKLESCIAEMAKKFGERLTFGAIGFNRNSAEFSILQRMTKVCEEHGANSTFQHVKGDPESLSIAVSTLTNSMVQSRTTLTELAGSKRQTVRNVTHEKIRLPVSLYPDPNEWNILYVVKNRLQRSYWDRQGGDWYYKDVESGVRGIAIKKSYFDKGVERMVFLLRKLGIDEQGRDVFLPGDFVAKECKYVEDEWLKYSFHTTFYRTQMKAQEIADKFNAKISETKKLHPYISVAKITFLDCWVYTYYPTLEPNNQKGVLCEKYIDSNKYTKWNSNNGFVDGDRGLAMRNNLAGVNIAPMPLDAILEDSSEEESENESESNVNPIISVKKYPVNVGDYPQCFSHFSYRHTGRKMLVCDLQGVLDSSKQPPVYELTDPVIHYSQRKQGKRKFGRTNLGDRGINMFFNTHKCNNLCILLGLPSDS